MCMSLLDIAFNYDEAIMAQVENIQKEVSISIPTRLVCPPIKV